MNLSRILFLSLACLTGLVTGVMGVSAQSAQQIVAKYLEALGGKEKLQSINSLYIEGVGVLENGTKVGVKTWRVYDRLYRQEISLPGGNMVIVVTPRQGWSFSPETSGLFKPLTDEQFRTLKPAIDPAGPLVDYNAKGNKIELAGKDTVQGQECYKIKVYYPSGMSAMYFIDEKTWYILRETHKSEDESGGNTTIDYKDYKIIPGGYIFPYTIIISRYGAKISVEKVQINSTINTDVLSRPNK
jgi:outer membrane lipoprotein-sorting protein